LPLSDAQPRTRLHTRTITLEGFQREDGLFERPLGGGTDDLVTYIAG
jgi:hypothetical protein